MRAAKRIDGTMGNKVQKEMYQRATKWMDETKCSELQGTTPAAHCILSHPSIWWLSGTSPSVPRCPSLPQSRQRGRQRGSESTHGVYHKSFVTWIAPANTNGVQEFEHLELANRSRN